MIQDHDRSGYFGASDTRFVVARNRQTKTWKKWWEVKLGAPTEEVGSIYMDAGNRYEHPILKAINEGMETDGQILLNKYPVRVNYDGWHQGTIYEVKTHKADKPFDLSTAYWMQAQVEMYVYREMSGQWFLPPFERLYVVSYGLHPDEYELYGSEIEIDPNRIVYHPVAYDKAFIKGEYLPNVRELTKALRKGKFPA